MRRIYVGNIAYYVTADQLRDLFAGAGTVVESTIVSDRHTGQSRGFGFVEMSTEDEARKAIEQFDGRDIQGRALVVREARTGA